MSDIRIRKLPGKWVVRAGGAVLGESENALEMSEDGLPDVVYFPREDIAMALLEKTATETVCPKKGTASYYSIVTKSTVLEDAAWSYEAPIAAVSRIAGHLAFYPGKATVEAM